jgi:LacI family transcriptional regulator
LAPDDRGGARLAIEHLHSLGRRRIAHVTGPASYLAVRDRIAGAQDVLSDVGLAFVGKQAYNGDWNEVWGRTAVDIVLRADPRTDGIFCGNDQIARGVCEALRERGVRVPDDIAVIGFDNWDVVVSGCRPPLTTIDLNLEALGRAAARQVFEAIDGDHASGVIEIACRLVTRESTAPTAREPPARSEN